MNKQKLRNNRTVMKIYNSLISCIWPGRIIKSKIHLKKIIKKKYSTCDRIGVIFLTQYIPAWNKSEPIYKIMKEDDRFVTYIVCVPNDLNCKVNDNDVFNWFKDNNYECKKAKKTETQWFDLSELGAEYVFYCRPYNKYLPEIYKSKNVGKYLKICNLMYGFTFSKADIKNSLNKDFFVDCYTYYACSDDDLSYFYSIRHSKYQRCKYLGYPSLTNMINKMNSESQGRWESNHDSFRIIWTPRWSTDVLIGGSNFFNYKDDFFRYAETEKNIELMIRPHPLAFDNFINNGQMTVEEVRNYKNHCFDSENIILDEKKEYIESFWNTDVLVSDVSTVIIEFFVTGKPIIFCDSNSEFNKNYSNTMLNILSGTYVANSFENIRKYISDLKSGKDPLKERRNELINTIWGDKIKLCPQLIVDDLLDDCKKYTNKS